MVAITEHRLAVSGFAYNSGVPGAFQVPTAFSPTVVKYGADTCSDQPSPTTMAGKIFIPLDYAAFHPTLNDRVSYMVSGWPGYAPVFRGRIDGLTIEDVDGATYGPRFPNSRNLTTLAGWEFTTGTARPVPATGLLTASPHRVGLKAPSEPGAIGGTAAIIRTPRAPVVAGKAYVFTAHANDDFSQPNLEVEWFNAAGTSISTDYVPNHRVAVNDQPWFPIYTEPRLAPATAVKARFIVRLTAPPTGGTVYLDTVNLLTEKETETRQAGRWVSFQASDITASAGRLMIGDEPWPAQDAEQRIGRLSQLVPANVMTFQTNPSDQTMLAYRDIDNQSALSVFQRIATSIGTVAMASPQYETLITTATPPRTTLSLEVVSGTLAIVEDPSLVKIPAGSIRKGPLSTSITGLSNTVKFNYRVATEGGSEDAAATISNTASISNYGPMARTLDTDLPSASGKAWQQAQRMVTAQANPVYRLADSANVVVARLPETLPSWSIFNAMTGFRRLVHVPDAPALIGPYHRINGASMTFGKETKLSLDLEPADLIAPVTVTFYDLSRPPYNNMPFTKFTNLTFLQLGTVSKAADY
ncbi:hypothetical protein [Arthrobacter sp. GMC3]|uniref:hypothetical protein n=1 Tax=Arthrobacter sp. GMC3 TaxID=2058894 RepID=UPI000CE480F0|nr:hypothetical protein [Arthrobacter sp. GMC3]